MPPKFKIIIVDSTFYFSSLISVEKNKEKKILHHWNRMQIMGTIYAQFSLRLIRNIKKVYLFELDNLFRLTHLFVHIFKIVEMYQTIYVT